SYNGGKNERTKIKFLCPYIASCLLHKNMAKPSSPTETEQCIDFLITVFQKCTEFLTFMNTELAAFTKNQDDPGVLQCMMKKLYLNSSGQIDFQEFLNLTGGTALACHDSFTRSTHSWK
uniref:Uncharacterized protein n=1 Tax=Ailuropoda melanoleuca TaxID=9646 RepID=G1LC12_AILME